MITATRVWLRRFWWRLCMLFSRNRTVFSVPVAAECAHDADAHALMLRLLQTVHDPQRFADEISRWGNCRGCSLGVVTEAIYTIAGAALDSDPEDCDLPVVGGAGLCHHRSADALALRLILSADSDDDHALSKALSEAFSCSDCVLEVIMSLVRNHLSLLNNAHPAWQAVFENQLLEILNEAD